MRSHTYILGAGVTGLAAGWASGAPVFEAADGPGGICSSYYVKPGESERMAQPPTDGEAYRFEIGGGHWIFGGDPLILRFIRQIAPVRSYRRKSSVYFSGKNIYAPFPLQNHLRFLDREIACRALVEMAGSSGADARTMKESLEAQFGPTLCRLFFGPFHERYTAGLYDRIAPQDGYKTPAALGSAIEGAFGQVAPVGYNVEFIYPVEGLNALAQRMARCCDVKFGKQVEKIDFSEKIVRFSDGSEVRYDTLVSTLPLNKVMRLTGLEVDAEPDPFTSVLVLNIGAVRGERCPDDHWLYNPDAGSGFHRVGFYSNVDVSFLPRSAQNSKSRVGIYVERAYLGGLKPAEQEITEYTTNVIRELQEWGYIEATEVVDPTWIDVAYTWAWPGSQWRKKAIRALEEQNIYQVGRYGRWVFQGIADSIRDGFFAGAAAKFNA